MGPSDWHIFLAVSRHGSTLAASRHLATSQSTISRRIEALETALGIPLFDKRPTGYALTDAGKAMVPKAEAIEAAVGAAILTASQQHRGLAGRIRFTTLEAFAQTFIIPALSEFRTAYPDIHIEMIVHEDPLDLVAGGADVALRAGPAPTASGLVIRRVLTDGWSVYCSRAYAERNGVPRSAEELRDHSVIGLPWRFRDVPMTRWIDDIVPETAIVLRTESIPGLLVGIKSGVGVSLMSDMVAETDAALMRCFVPPEPVGAPVWLVTTEHLRHEPRIRALLEFMAGYLVARRFRADGVPGEKVS